jgi:hypothetical protein
MNDELISNCVQQPEYLFYRHLLPNQVWYCRCNSMRVVLAWRLALTLPFAPVSTSDQMELSFVLYVTLKQVQKTSWVQAPAREPSLLQTKQRL